MAQDHRRLRQAIDALVREMPAEALAARLAARHHPPTVDLPTGARAGTETGAEAIAARWAAIPESAAARAVLAPDQAAGEIAHYAGNIENCIGAVRVPVGVAGPLRVNGLFAQGDYLVPLATTEAALVASCARGCGLITAAGGASAAVLGEAVGRAPAFLFDSLAEAGQFVAWVTGAADELAKVAEATTRHGRLIDLKVAIEGNHVYLLLEYVTGDAAGQNMVTIATEAVCRAIVETCPITPKTWFVEANMSGDKKASAQSFITLRGRKATAEVTLPPDLVRRVLHVEPDRLVECWRIGLLGAVMSGTVGAQAHFANPLAALFIATGQDAACVAEAAVGVTRFELTEAGGVYATVTQPNLIVGTVGGGTRLPSQAACLDLMGLKGTGKAQALAEVAAALCLAAELSIIGAMAAGHFTSAHQRLARTRQAAEDNG